MNLADIFGDAASVVATDDAVRPARAYAFFEDGVPSPAVYLEVSADAGAGTAGSVPVVIHNFRYYGWAMRRWDADAVDLLVLNELHELTHWAMTDGERERWDRRSANSGRPDGHWMNPPLFDVIDFVSRADRPPIGEHPPSLFERFADWLRGLA
jgi:hypothetical protein